MDFPSGSTGVDVDRTFSGNCNRVKFVQTGSSSSKSWNIKVPFNDCQIQSIRKIDSVSQNEYTEYALYWNSQISSSSSTQVYQTSQVKIVCRLNPIMLSGTSITAPANSFALPSPPESKVDISSKLSLEIGKVAFSQSILVDETRLTQVDITSSNANNPIIGQPNLTYIGTKSAEIGDYMQLRLVDSSNEVLNKYS